MDGPARPAALGSSKRYDGATSVADCDAWVTGRYHFALAAMCSGQRFLAVRTRVSKMQGMMHDARLSDFLLDETWLQSSVEEQIAIVRGKMNAWDEDAFGRAENYRSVGKIHISDAFDHMASLAS
jgi:polysaccharide pyruvyl transferase WcaK-like protein